MKKLKCRLCHSLPNIFFWQKKIFDCKNIGLKNQKKKNQINQILFFFVWIYGKKLHSFPRHPRGTVLGRVPVILHGGFPSRPTPWFLFFIFSKLWYPNIFFKFYTRILSKVSDTFWYLMRIQFFYFSYQDYFTWWITLFLIFAFSFLAEKKCPWRQGLYLGKILHICRFLRGTLSHF